MKRLALILLLSPVTALAVTSRVDSSCIITTVAFNGAGSGGDGGPATSAQSNQPRAAVADAAGNIYVADTFNHKIRKITQATGFVSTVAGTGAGGWSGDGGAATAGQLNTPQGIAVDAAGNLYIADTNNHRIRRVTPGGIISTIAGTGAGGFSGDGGAATAAQINTPWAIVVDAAGNIYFTDTQNHRVRKIAAGTGVITTVAGNGGGGWSGDGGVATAAQLNTPGALALDAAGNIYIADTNSHRIRKVTVATGIITTIAGTGAGGFSGDGGPATGAQINTPDGIAVDAWGNVFISDMWSNRVRRIDAATGTISTVVGTGAGGGSGDLGPAGSAQLNQPAGLSFDANGNLLITDRINNRIRRVAACVAVGSPTPTYTRTPSFTVTVTPLPTVAICATPGKDGAASPSGVVNTYYAGNGNVAAGALSIPVGAPQGAATAITAGDLLLVIQMQGAGISTSNSVAYGDGATGRGWTTLGGAGNYEYVVASGPVAGGFVPVLGARGGGGLINGYSRSAASAAQGQASYQVIRVPQYSNATLTSSLTALRWNGTVGGVLAIDVQNQLNLNSATVSLDGLGFRGAGGVQLVGGFPVVGSPSDYLTDNTFPQNGGKGEGIAGTPRWIYDIPSLTTLATGQGYAEGYPLGSMGRGAPGTAGGGGTDGDNAYNGMNSGGGGGSNAGAGGQGGNSYLTNLPIGGIGGAGYPFNFGHLVLGGGGGAGSRNDSVVNGGSSGGAGGGMALIRACTVIGTGTINANGVAGPDVPTYDSSGGGGAGGSIVVVAATGGLAGLNLNARGGNGANNTGPPEHGPGGGGGGGVIYTSSAPASAVAIGGNPGWTVAAGTFYSAQPGSNGVTAGIGASQISGAGACPGCVTTPTPTVTATRTWTPTVTITVSPTRTPSPTSSVTFTPTPTQSPTRTATPTSTFTATITRTPTSTITPSVTFTRTSTPTATPTATVTITTSPTFTRTVTPTLTATPTLTVTSTATRTATVTITTSPSFTLTSTPTRTATPSHTPTATYTATPSITVTRSPTPTFTATPTWTITTLDTSTSTPTRSPTPSSSPTRTATPSMTLTRTPTPTRTATPTWTITTLDTSTSTPTRTATPTITLTRTPTPSMTSTRTATPTYTATPTWTITTLDTSTSTPSRTPTPSMTPTRTPTSTYTATATWTITTLDTSTSTSTVTSTPSHTRTLTPTRTHTLSSTPTPTFSETSIYTATSTPTASPSSSATPTLTQTRTASPTSSATVSFSPTSTYSATASNTSSATSTPTVTVTPSKSPSLTASQTPVPLPMRLEVSVYNAAGERVRSLYSGYSEPSPGGFKVSTSSLVPGLTTLSISFAGTLETGGKVLMWNGDNDNGQPLLGGSYTIKSEMKDVFGVVEAWSTPMLVMPAYAPRELNIYNSAGELVVRLDAGTSVGIREAGKQNNSNGDFEFVLEDTNGASVSKTWDGHNANGARVSPGSYTLQLVDANAGHSIVMSKGFVIVGIPETDSFQVSVGPNPLIGAQSTLIFSLQGLGPSQIVRLRIYNLAGELLTSAETGPGATAYSLPLGAWSSGVYVAVAEKINGQARLSRKILKLAIQR